MIQKTDGKPFVLPGHPFSWLVFAQLVRLPNVFTAMADICLAGLASAALPELWQPFLLVLASSCCLYLAGMVWNDIFDLEEDQRDRSFRPLPSGRVSLKNALALGVLLTGAGIALAGLAGVRPTGFNARPLIVAGLLVANIFFYDAWLKHTLIGPVAMGGCRFFNVLLGLSIVPTPGGAYLLAGVVGLYIVGVTWFARTEATTSNQQHLLGAVMVMALALILSLALPEAWKPTGGEGLDLPFPLSGKAGLLLFPYLLVAFALYVGLALHKAIRQPRSANVQKAVKRSVLGLILLDAILAAALTGLFGLVIAALLAPARFLGRRVYST